MGDGRFRLPFRGIVGLTVQAKDQLRRTLDAIERRVNENTPPGALMTYAGQKAPPGWLVCDGTAVSRTTYAELFAAIGTEFGGGDGSTTFNLPNMNDRFPRGANNAAEVGDTGGSATASMPFHGHGFVAEAPGTSFQGTNHGHGFSTGFQSANHAHIGTTHINDGIIGGWDQACCDRGHRNAFSGPWHGSTHATAGIDTNHSHSGTTSGNNASHSHTVNNHGHGFVAEGSGDNNPPYVDFRFLIKT